MTSFTSWCHKQIRLKQNGAMVMRHVSLWFRKQHKLPLTEARGLGVGSRPPPGRSPATALAGAISDKAFDSSGITPSRSRKLELKAEKWRLWQAQEGERQKDRTIRFSGNKYTRLQMALPPAYLHLLGIFWLFFFYYCCPSHLSLSVKLRWGNFH